MEEGRYRLDMRSKIFTVRLVRHWSILPSEVVLVPSPEALKARLDWTLSNII